MFLSHNPVTPAKTSPRSPPDSWTQPSCCYVLVFITQQQQQQRIKCSLRTVCPQCNPTHFVHGQHRMGGQQMLWLRFRAPTTFWGKCINLRRSGQKQICLYGCKKGVYGVQPLKKIRIWVILIPLFFEKRHLRAWKLPFFEAVALKLSDKSMFIIQSLKSLTINFRAVKMVYSFVPKVILCCNWDTSKLKTFLNFLQNRNNFSSAVQFI